MRNGDLSVLISAKARLGTVIAGVWSSREAPAGPESLRLRPGWGIHQRSGISPVRPPPPKCLRSKKAPVLGAGTAGICLHETRAAREGGRPPATRACRALSYVAGPNGDVPRQKKTYLILNTRYGKRKTNQPTKQ